MLKLVHNLRCRSNFAKRVLLLGSSHQNSPKRPYFTKVGDFIGDFYQQMNQNFIALPRLLWKSILWSISVYALHCKLHVHSCYTFPVTCPIATGDARLCNRSEQNFHNLFIGAMVHPPCESSPANMECGSMWPKSLMGSKYICCSQRQT